MSFEEVQARKQAWIVSRTNRQLKAERVTLRLLRDLRGGFKYLGAAGTAKLVAESFRKHGYPREIRRHL